MSAQNSDYCQFGSRTTLFLIDQTTSYDEQDEALLVEGLSRFDRSLALGERLVIATINDAAQQSSLLFDQCKPGCPDVHFLEELFSSCKRLIARRDASEFRTSFVAVLKSLLEVRREYEHSAILETIKARSDEVIQGPTDRLIIFSDLLENSRASPWPAIVQRSPAEALTQAMVDGVIPSLSGAQVIAFGLGRAHTDSRSPLDPSDLSRLVQFWEAYFHQADAGAASVGIAYPARSSG